MFSNRSTFSQISNRRGQVALFVALIFQILFLFFAMVINVGLLVHHKINLQNSVDLAAYYGAMRQAEGMNAIAHTNYQIRQSYKLLAWRYRMLGSAGEFRYHPYSKSTHQFQGSTEDIVTDSPGPQKDFQEAPAFCITYVPFKGMPPNENTCKDMANKSGITVFKAPPLIAGFQTFSGAIKKASEAWRDNLTQRCKLAGSYNYYMLGKFVVAFNIDQGDRMYLISLLSQALSYKKDDFYDIDGELASQGITNTLKKNLTSANNNSDLGVQIYNSLGADGCNAQSGADDQPAQWLTPVKIYPGFSYIDNECPTNGRDKINTVAKELTGDVTNPKFGPNYLNEMTFAGDLKQLAQYIGYRSNLNDTYNFSLGVEKSPWCMAYVGVSATAKPRIPFSPFGSITLKARAFYKPFGGRVGPWYKSIWPRGSKYSSSGEKLDPLAPPRVSDAAQLQNNSINQDPAELAVRAVNHSRFVGDRFGLKTLLMLAHYGKAIFEMDPGWRNMFATGPNNSYASNAELYEGSSAPNFSDWDDIPFTFAKGSGDILAWDSGTNMPSKMRNLELLAVLPDPYDIAYYSIDPDFYRNYYLRLKNGFLNGPGRNFTSSGKQLRPDIGYHKNFKAGKYNLEEFSIKDQYAAIEDSGLKDVVDRNFTFLSKDWRHVLTGWTANDLMDYSLNTSRFGKCTDATDPSPPTSGNCVVGGTTGFSVKMTSSSYLRGEIPNLGGEGASGTILNPPPSDDEF